LNTPMAHRSAGIAKRDELTVTDHANGPAVT
jgi:hypothetical protein